MLLLRADSYQDESYRIYQLKLKSISKRIFVARQNRINLLKLLFYFVYYEVSTCAKPIVPCKFILGETRYLFIVLIAIQQMHRCRKLSGLPGAKQGVAC